MDGLSGSLKDPARRGDIPVIPGIDLPALLAKRTLCTKVGKAGRARKGKLGGCLASPSGLIICLPAPRIGFGVDRLGPLKVEKRGLT